MSQTASARTTIRRTLTAVGLVVVTAAAIGTLIYQVSIVIGALVQ